MSGGPGGEPEVTAEPAPALNPTAPADGAGQDLLDVLDADAVALPARRRRVFQGYHKPRKQWIRIKQVCAALAELLKTSPPTGGRPVTYFGLPGDDLLDLRAIHGVCTKYKASLRFLGFNSGAAGDERRAELDVSLSEVRSLERVDGASDVIADRLESLGVADHVAFQRFSRHGPYTIVNFDLCNSLAGVLPGEGPSAFAALHQVLLHQFKRMADPWLLFLTTRVDAPCLDPRCVAALLDVVDSNCRQHPEFEGRFAETAGVSPTTLRESLDRLADIDGGTLRPAFAVAVAKWIIAVSNPGQRRWRVTLLPSVAYSVSEVGAQDMLSLGFRLEPVPFDGGNHFGLGVGGLPHDRVPAAEVAAEGDAHTEDENHDDEGDELLQAMAILPVVREILDLDRYLETNQGEREYAVSSATRLMVKARYPEAEYRAWVDDGCPSQNDGG